jgi:thermostable 8-oxoguanine DNA glycosylase
MDHLDSYREDFENLKGFTNNSYVGMSKVLHFINPELFCIYDSRIVKRLRKVTNCTPADITFLKLCPILYSIKNALKISMQEIDLILWL